MKTKISTLLMALFLYAGMGFAQDAPAEDAPKEEKAWKFGGMGNLNLNQVGLFNWQGGGTSNMTMIGRLNFFGNYKKETITWDNSLDLGYGLLYNNLFSKYDSLRTLSKAEDRIELNSKFGKKIVGDKLFFSVFLNFLTQFDKGLASAFDDRKTQYISRFLSPGYIKFGVGIDWKPNDDLSVNISPIATKITIVADTMLANAESFGVNKKRLSDQSRFVLGASQNVRAELGASLRVQYKRDIMKNIGLDTKLDVFFNYLQMPNETFYETLPGDTTGIGMHADVDWQTNIVAKINKYINVTLFTHLLFDGDAVQTLYKPGGDPVETDAAGNISKGIRVQFKEVFGVGFSYKF